MKILGLMRHAKSDWNDGDTREFVRGLNARGRKGPMKTVAGKKSVMGIK